MAGVLAGTCATCGRLARYTASQCVACVHRVWLCAWRCINVGLTWRWCACLALAANSYSTSVDGNWTVSPSVSVANMYQEVFRYITSTRGPVPVSSGTHTRVVGVSGQHTELLPGTQADMHANESEENSNQHIHFGSCGDDETAFIVFVFALSYPLGNRCFSRFPVIKPSTREW